MDTDQTLSVSKGVFIFKNDFKASKKQSKHKKKSVCQTNTLFSSNMWYQHYRSLWDVIEEEIHILNDNLFSSVLSNLINFVKTSHNDVVNEIPTAALFTGINMPDHGAQFESLSKQLRETTPHVAYLQSQDCQNIKYLMENMINEFVNGDLKDDSFDVVKSHIRKTQLNMAILKCWYMDLYEDSKKKPLAVIIPDFESFNPSVLQRFILIISCYLKDLPFVLIFGIATDMNALHGTLPYKVSSKIRVKVFNSQRSIEYLNNVLEKVFFSNVCPFQLGGRVFNLFMELFLFYDLSVNNFIRNIKYACADHFTYGNAMALCNLSKYVNQETIQEFTEDDFETVRQLPSFKKLVESESKDIQVKLLVDNDYLSEVLYQKICDIQTYIQLLHLFLRCLLVLVEDLPRAPLGKQVRELYAIATVKKITETSEYLECMKLLNFQSKDELCVKLTRIVEILASNEVPKNDEIKQFVKILSIYLKNLESIGVNDFEETMEECEDNTKPVDLKVASRTQLRQKLLEMTQQPNKSLTKYEKLREEIIKNISDTFKKFLMEPESRYFHEIFFYNNISIKNYIIGSHRSAIHNALNDPQFYLQCECCELANPTSINPTMPDICIAYKLHLEYGKMINLYDWLQSFLSIVDPDVDTQQTAKIFIKPELQARFTQAVAELEHLGFIKSSKRKTDHVQRLTWGG
ncbi:origin recognition complex subunit 3 [Diorhabda sublineata]|uniref:origin recognition complex subunit 3 n=1 Tax=Diorhabda sublineata TaxID=1163346 RepID=UPI0024E16F83|nr:origin recognition complex subunit 3 [Diorhabda sublineata]